MAEFTSKVEFEDCQITFETDNALKVRIEGKDVWIPKTQVDDDSEVWRFGDTGKLVISEWCAMQKGLV